MTWICLFLQSELPAAVITGKVWLFLLVHQMQVRPSIMCLDIPSSECKLLLCCANVFCNCDTFFNHYVGEHFSDSLSHRLTGEQLQEDDRLRHEVISNVKNQLIFPQNQVDRLAQDFSLAAKEEAIEAIGIGEQMLELMDRLGFSPSVTWPGYLRLTELLLKVRVRFHKKEKKNILHKYLFIIFFCWFFSPPPAKKHNISSSTPTLGQ